jgi:hypothetical protein
MVGYVIVAAQKTGDSAFLRRSQRYRKALRMSPQYFFLRGINYVREMKGSCSCRKSSHLFLF